MRRMRGPLQWFLLIAGVVAAGFGARYFAHHFSNPTPTVQGAKGVDTKTPIARAGTGSDARDDEDLDEAISSKRTVARPGLSGIKDEDSDDADLDDETAAGEDITPSAEAEACAPLELPGVAPWKAKVSRKEWATVMSRFHEVKADLRSWLRRHSGMFPRETYAVMIRQLEELKLQRPPATDMPDLSWRGIGVWTRSGEDPAILKMGTGLVKLINENPRRGKFELARLAAQTWSPCELRRYAEKGKGTGRLPASIAGAVEPWAALSKCLGVEDPNACLPGSYSEAGWAVSSVVASMISTPGCTIPALRGKDHLKCLAGGTVGTKEALR